PAYTRVFRRSWLSTSRFTRPRHFYGSWFIKRWIMPLAQQGLTNGCENLIIIVVANVKREVPVNAFQRTGPVKAASAAGTNASLDRIFRQMLHAVASAATSHAGFVIARRLPHAGDMLQPQISGLNVDSALRDVMLNVRIGALAL